MEDKQGFGVFVAGLVIGGLVGAAVALLLAPQSGEETRTAIRDKSIELRDRAVEQGQVISQATRDKAIELQQRGQTAIEEQKSRVQGAVSRKPAAPAESSAGTVQAE